MSRKKNEKKCYTDIPILTFKCLLELRSSGILKDFNSLKKLYNENSVVKELLSGEINKFKLFQDFKNELEDITITGDNHEEL